MINIEVTIALIIMEALLLVGFLGVIVAISRFSTQIKETEENLYENLTGNIKELRKELKNYRDEIELMQKRQKDNIDSASKS